MATKRYSVVKGSQEQAPADVAHVMRKPVSAEDLIAAVRRRSNRPRFSTPAPAFKSRRHRGPSEA
jgi:hypothetical protein